MLATGAVMADVCLVVYPNAPCIYHYDPTEYYTVGPGHPLYDPMFDRGGEVLLELGTDEIDYSIYQAPQLMGFTVSTDGNDGYFFYESFFDIVIDGWSNEPTTYVNIILVFEGLFSCTPVVWVEGEMVAGNMYQVGDLEVSTPTPYGNNYSDTITLQVNWAGCTGMLMWAWSDENYNWVRDGGECFTAFSHDSTVPVERTSWGAIKSLFK
jgi:hypothetical protein